MGVFDQAIGLSSPARAMTIGSSRVMSERAFEVPTRSWRTTETESTRAIRLVHK